MNKTKRFALLCLVTALFVSIIAGCSGKGSESEPSSSGGSSEPAASATSSDAASASANPFEEHMDISVSWWGIGAAFEGQDEIIQKLEKDFNITFKAMDIGWDNYKEKSQVWAVAGQLPDIITHSITNDQPATYNEWISQELIKPLPDDLSAYPNVQNVAKAEDVQGLYRDGKLFAIPRMTYPNTDLWAIDRAIYVRKDWMEKLGIKDPTSFDEFKAMLKAFTEQDPDGNNKKDTTGITMNTMGYLKNLFIPAFPQFENGGWVKEDGKWIPYFSSKQMDGVVTQARQLYAEGLLDQDFAVQKAGEGNQKFYQNKAGAFAIAASSVGGATGVKAEWEKNNPGENFFDHVKLLHLWPAADGTVYRHTTISWWSETMINAEVDDKKLDRILRVYDWLLSPAGKEMFDYGIEGKDYTKDGDKITVTREKDENGNFVDLKKKYPSMDVISQLAQWRNASSIEDSESNRAALGDDVVQFIQDELKWQMDNAKPIPTEFGIYTMSTPGNDKIQSIDFDDDFTRLILGKEDPVKQWKDIVKGYDSKGLQEAITEVNAEMTKQGK
ncbi:extracellular solute-binding protein [Cohnella lupini]|uniref:Putative aldouronate transport system substrate-binding protein n=1 Tax=Cohnella lupini TaxID=1294267 RepID=A0A3D9INA9_9BACL|nr:extracellular solute-binding protein [Cohnella lupini]RED63252.1 putative aldouronate transport system substrate-binding protein [Cohnella lupini]